MLRPILSVVFSCVIILTLLPRALANDKLPVFVSIGPQKYFVQQIGKDLVDVQLMVQPGTNPHTYEPKPRQMVAISKAKLYFAIGIEFEKAILQKIVSINPHIKVVNTDHGIQKIPMTAPQHVEPEHHQEAEHRKPVENGHQNDHRATVRLDPHIWLSPRLVIMQARMILNALQEADPTNHSNYEAYYQDFKSDLVKLDNELKKIFESKQGLSFMVFHPSWGYFAHSYGLKQVAIEIEGKNPKSAQLQDLIEHAKEINIKVVFVQPQFSTKSAKLIAKEIGGEVAFVDPLAENWSANLREVASKFKAVLK